MRESPALWRLAGLGHQKKAMTIEVRWHSLFCLLYRSSSDREEDAGEVYDAGHGDAGEEGTHHDELGREVFAVVKFDGIEDGVHGGGDRRHDEDGLIDDRREMDTDEGADLNHEVAADGADDEADEAADPGIEVAEGKGASVDLHAEGYHDDGDQCIRTIFKDRPNEELRHVKPEKFDGKDRDQCIDDRHMEDDGECVARCQLPFACLIESQGIEGHIHLYEHDGRTGAGLCEIGRLSINEVGRVAEDQSDECDADVSVIGKHGAVFQGFRLGGAHAPHFPRQPGDESDEEHLHKRHEEDIQHREVDFRYVDAIEDKAREDDVECELREGCDIEREAAVQEIADGYEDQKWKDIIRNDL